MIVLRKFTRAMRAACPPWLVIIWTIAACVPTPFEIDELVPLVLTIAVLAIQPQRIPKARSAWRGGKSHRAWDAGRVPQHTSAKQRLWQVLVGLNILAIAWLASYWAWIAALWLSHHA